MSTERAFLLSPTLRRRLLRWAMMVLACLPWANTAFCAEEPRAGVWAWKAVTVSPGGGNDDVWGGRVSYREPLGRLWLSARVDFSGLKGEFDLERPGTYRTAELYFAADYAITGRLSAGVVYGFMRPYEDPAAREIGALETWAVCARVAVRGSGYVRPCLGTHEPSGDRSLRFLVSAHVPLWGPSFVGIDGPLTGSGRQLRIMAGARVSR